MNIQILILFKVNDVLSQEQVCNEKFMTITFNNPNAQHSVGCIYIKSQCSNEPTV